MMRHCLLATFCGAVLALGSLPVAYQIHAAPPATAPVGEEEGYSAPALAAADPMEFHEPKVMAAIVDPLSDAEYDKRAGALQLAAPATAAQAKLKQVLYVVAAAVEPGGGADHAGVKPGDILASMDGDILLYQWQVREAEGEHVDAAFAIISPGKEARYVKLEARHFDIDMETHWDAAVAWDRQAGHDPRFDSFIRVAAAAYLSDPPLAWSALARAQKAGCDGRVGGYVPPALAALTAFGQQHFDEALAFAAIACHDMPAEERVFFSQRMLTCATATFKLPLALELMKSPGMEVKTSDQIRTDAMKQAVAEWQALPSRALANPLTEIADYDFRDVTAQAVALIDSPREAGSKWLADRVKKQRKFSAEVISGHTLFGTLGPAGKEIDASIEFSFTSYQDKLTNFGHTFVIGVAAKRRENDPPTPAQNRLLRVALFHHGLVMVSRYGTNDYNFWQAPTPDGHHRARIIVIGRRCEVILDGRRVLYCPLSADEKDRELGLTLQMVGVKSVVHRCTVKVAEAKKGT